MGEKFFFTPSQRFKNKIFWVVAPKAQRHQGRKALIKS